MYAIIDTETTGGSPRFEKITEIAVFIHDGNQILEEYCTLINPEKHIPAHITSITGITNEMVEHAPKFYEVARKIVELTEGCIFVAHNVSFDYNFIRSEFKQLGYDFERTTLCTVKLSRKLIPGLTSYSLGNLCNSLGICINGRHRASGDGMATVRLFELLQEKNIAEGSKISFQSAKEGRYKHLNGFVNPADIERIPEQTGVYYFHDSEGNLIYIGKSKNIYHRILSHFASNISHKAGEMKSRIAGISYELTGSELVALLKESVEIKEHKPLYNKSQRRIINSWGLYSSFDSKGYLNYRIKRISSENKLPVTSFSSKEQAEQTLSSLVEKHWLCQKLCGLYVTEGACFHYDIRQCNGACTGKEPANTYNARAKEILKSYESNNENYIIIDKGRTTDERSVVCVENGVYQGYGYINIQDTYFHVRDFMSCIKKTGNDKDARMIIQSWMKKNKTEKLIRF